jgi:hypothetical protein
MIYGEPVRERLAQALDTMLVWEALRARCEVVAETVELNPQWALRATRVMISTPTLRASNTEKYLTRMTVLLPLVAASMTGPEATQQYYARAITLSAIICLDLSSSEFVHHNGKTTTRELLDEAFQLLKPTELVN